MKIIITGASGFIGSYYINKNKIDEVREICLLNKSLTSFDFYNYDVLIHLAAMVHRMNGASESEYFKVNSDLAFDTALKAKNEGISQFIFLSTIKVYGESTTGRAPFDEWCECNPYDAYGKSKLDGEKRILSLEDENFKVSIVRSPLVYGCGVKANMFNLIKLIDKIPVLPFGKINNKRSFVYVGNLTALINRIIMMNASGIFIAGDPENLSTTDLSIEISKALKKRRLLIPLPFFIKKVISVIFPLQYDRLWGSLEVNPCSGWQRIDFIPPFSIQNGIAEMVKWYLTIKHLKEK